MENKQKYQDVFIKSLSIDESKLTVIQKYNEISRMGLNRTYDLISGLEESFGISNGDR